MKILLQIILLISKLPMRIHYVFSDFLFIVNYYLVGYRKKVVMNNLKNSFPNKSNQELEVICKEFYKNFSDYIVETVKSFTISSKELRVRVQHINQDVFSEAKKEGKNVIMLAGHVFNWEWYNALATILPQKNTFAVYRKVNNSFWENQIKKIRGNYGNTAIEANEVLMHIFRNPNDGNSAYMFVADASPHVNMVDYGVSFLNQKTPAFIGYDKLATRKDFHFIYCDMKKVKRGFYQVNYYRILPDELKFKEYEVVNKFHELLEKTIQKHPDNYLWSHRKWKYQHAIKKMDNK
ncbi:MAG: lysophospholipid acyltransferase family protein [Bacteroidetes bacterium]|nr:lysophospholipid acyltransferase family protein [Bacteroidota bacterium]